eukprot:5289999-Prymnesium_polylepis.2
MRPRAGGAPTIGIVVASHPGYIVPHTPCVAGASVGMRVPAWPPKRYQDATSKDVCPAIGPFSASLLFRKLLGFCARGRASSGLSFSRVVGWG